MATLYITEYDRVPIAAGGSIAMGAEPAAAAQTVTIGGVSQQSNPFGPTTIYVCLSTDAVCSIVFGPNPTATPLFKRMAANQTEYLSVRAGDKVAVISNV
jgi:hypothetical protein